jgi:hydrogenase nickel incorporation protein HypB
VAAEFDVEAARRNIEGVRPGMRIFEVSAKTGQGMEDVFRFLRERQALRQRERMVEHVPR